MGRRAIGSILIVTILLLAGIPLPPEQRAWAPVGVARADHLPFSLVNLTADPGQPNSTTDVIVLVHCDPCDDVRLTAKRITGATITTIVGNKPLSLIPPSLKNLTNGNFTHRYIQIPAANLTFNATVNLTVTGFLAGESKRIYTEFVVANSHPVATVHPVLKNQGLSTTRMSVLNLTRFYSDGWQDVVRFDDKENTTGYLYADEGVTVLTHQNLSFAWHFTEGNYSYFSNVSMASHSWRALGDFNVRVTVTDWPLLGPLVPVDSTTADILVHVRNFVPRVNFVDARVVPASNSDTSTDPGEEVGVTNVVRVKVSWQDDDQGRGADRVYLDLYNINSTSVGPSWPPNASFEVNQSTLYSATESVFELPLLDFAGSRVKVCIRDVVSNLVLADGTKMPGENTVLTAPGARCLIREIVQKFQPMDLRDIRILHVVPGEAPVSTMGNVSDFFVSASVDLSTPEARNRTEEAFLNATRLAIAEHPRIFAVEGTGYPLTERVEEELGRLRDYGTLILAPVESRSIGVTQYFTAAGIGSSRWAIGVGIANQSTNGSRLGTPAGPDALMSAKPDFPPK